MTLKSLYLIRNLKTRLYFNSLSTSGVLEHKWRASLKTILFLLTSNTEATEKRSSFLI